MHWPGSTPHIWMGNKAITTLLRAYEAATLQALTGYTCIVEAMHAVCS
jgi:hypothetical protein